MTDAKDIIRRQAFEEAERIATSFAVDELRADPSWYGGHNEACEMIAAALHKAGEQKETGQWVHAEVASARKQALEEAAKVAEAHPTDNGVWIADRIRALIEKES